MFLAVKQILMTLVQIIKLECQAVRIMLPSD